MSHSQTDHKEPNYLGVIIVLALLTAVEIAVVFLPIPRLIVGICLVILALWKAGLVALYFMHLRFEKSTLAIIAVTPLFLCALLMFALLPDSNPERNLQAPTTTSAPAHPVQ